MEDFFNSKNIIKILIKWKYHLIVVLGLSVLLSAFFSSSVFITPLFKSFAVVYPSNIAPYSDESETEQMMQMMQSKDIRDSIIRKFDLAGHYGIDPEYKYFMSVLLFEYSKKVKVTKTPYEAVSVEVWDKNPKIACDMVNEILYQYNFKVRSLHKEKFGEVVNNYKLIMDAKKAELDSLQILSAELGTKYGLLDYPNQSKEVTRAYLSPGNAAKSGDINRLRKNMEEKGGEKEMLSQLMPAYANVYSILKLDYDRAVLDYNRNFTYVNVLNKPFPADKKAYPVRWIIVLLSALGTAVIAVLVIGFIERHRMSIPTSSVSR